MDNLTPPAKFSDPVFLDDFMRGGMDCSAGLKHKQFQSQAYDAGYAAQYELEQVITAGSLYVPNRMTREKV